MEIIPAIDFKAGKVVNLRQGRLDETTTYSDDPVGMAAHWAAQGCQRLHLVDLDGAFDGKPGNAAAIGAIAANHPEITIQLGGGVRSAEIIEAYLEAGVDQLIIGTMAVREPEFVALMCERFPGHIMVGLDAMDGMVAVDGWTEVTETSALQLAAQFANAGIEGIVYTDIGKDGMMSGVNVAATRELAEAVPVPVIASGGVTDMRDIEGLLAAGNIAGVIVGRAIYEGTLDLSEAINRTAN